MKPILLRNFFALSLLLTHISLLSQHFMYQPGYASGKACISEDHNMSVKFFINGGTTTKGRNANGTKVELLNLYGDEAGAYQLHGVDLSPLTGNLLILGQNAQVKDLTNKSASYGALTFKGRLNMLSGGASFYRRLSDHFSLNVKIPFHHFNVKDVTFANNTPAGENDGDAIAFAANSAAIYSAYNLHVGNVSDTTFGDMQIMTGIHFTREGDETLGNACVSLSTGITIPSARQRKLSEAFYIPMGNGQVGMPVALHAKLDVHEYASVNLHAGGEFFFTKRDSVFRMKTSENQNGFIKLATGAAREKLGHKFDVNGGLCVHNESKMYGVSVAYRWEYQRKTTLTPFDTVNFNTTIVNGDSMLQSWQRHNLVVNAFFAPEWDSSAHDCVCPKFGLCFTQPLKGKRIFNTNKFGGSVGIDFSWDF